MTDDAQSRRDRLKAALRENLKRRKAQARVRKDAAQAAGDGAPEPCDAAPRRED
jgi:hypothetical protein